VRGDSVESSLNGVKRGYSERKRYLVESYQVKAYFYLLKPVNAQDAVKLLNEIKNNELDKDTAGIKEGPVIIKITCGFSQG